MQIIIRDGACVGAGQCALVAGDVFDQDDDGLVTVIDDQPAEPLFPAIRRAASLCPARAITLEESSGLG